MRTKPNFQRQRRPGQLSPPALAAVRKVWLDCDELVHQVQLDIGDTAE
jgi:hypothetical protein